MGKEFKGELEFPFEGGILEYIAYINRKKKPFHQEVIYINGEKNTSMGEIAIQYTHSFGGTIISFANGIYTAEGGVHEIALKRALAEELYHYALSKKYLEGIEGFTEEDITEGLTVIINLKLDAPIFEGAKKMKLTNSEAEDLISSIIKEQFISIFEKNSEAAEGIINHIVSGIEASMAVKRVGNY